MKITEEKNMIDAEKLTEEFGSLVFSDKVMRERLPKDIYKAVHKTIEKGTHLELDVNQVVVFLTETFQVRFPFLPCSLALSSICILWIVGWHWLSWC